MVVQRTRLAEQLSSIIDIEQPVLENSRDDSEARSRVAASCLENADKVSLMSLDFGPRHVARRPDEIGPQRSDAIVRDDGIPSASQHIKIRRSLGACSASENRIADVELGEFRLDETTNSLAGA
jgi:hypothetical protein